MIDFDPDCPYGHIHSISGARMRLVCRDAKGEYPFLWLIESNFGEVEHSRFGRRDGSFPYLSGRAINAPAPKRAFEVWVNFYARRDGSIYTGNVHTSLELAKQESDGNIQYLLARIHGTGKEGDGL